MNLDIVDHIVYCVTDLNQACQNFCDKTGIMPSEGGRHLDKGTCNALVRIGVETYLEILAIDINNKNIKSERWMGIDKIKENRVTRWAIKSNRISKDADQLNRFNPELGIIEKGKRILRDGSSLEWTLTDPGSSPAISIIPFLLHWGASSHPTNHIPFECRLSELKFSHPTAYKFSTLFKSLNIDTEILEFPTPIIEMTLETPNGKITLS